jgi:glycosyltransferase involved in cell wall biosynthesis
MGRTMADAGDHGAAKRLRREPGTPSGRILPRHARNVVIPDLIMSSNPRVTVFIPAFNREDYICTAINSMLAQEYTDFEILVVDDGSTDRTPERVDAYSDPRVRLIRSESNQGIPASRNRGLAEARGEYIALLDSDDYSYPERLGVQVAWLDSHPAIVQVGSGCTLMDEGGELLRRVRRHPLRPEDVDAHLLFHCSLINRTIMARTGPLREFGYDTAFPRCQDYDLHVRLAEHYPMANLPQLLVCGREHPGRITKNTLGLGRDRKMAIQAKVLDQLGISHDERDLLWHYLLTQRADSEVPVAREYLDWAEHWLEGLWSANRRTGRFEVAAFRRTLGAIWAVACWHYSGGAGNSMIRRLLGSRLTLGLPGNLDPVTWARLLSQPRRRPALDPFVPG